MELLIRCPAALIAALLTSFSGLGLRTILTPVFAIFKIPIGSIQIIVTLMVIILSVAPGLCLV